MVDVVTSENRDEFMAERMRIVPEAPKAEEKPAEVVAEEVAEHEEVTEEEERQDKPKPKLQQRFSELTEKRRQAEERASAAEARAAAAEAKARELEGKANAPKAEPADPDLGPKPKPDDYTDAFEYAEHLAEWSSRKALADNEKNMAERAAKAEAQKVVDSFRKRVDAVKTEIPDYADVLASADHLSVSDAVRDAIIESEMGPKILYHLATHEDLVESLNSVKAATALRMIGKLEAELDKKKPEPEAMPMVKPRPKLPDPVTPISGGRAGRDDRVNSDGEFTGTYAQWKALRSAGKV